MMDGDDDDDDDEAHHRKITPDSSSSSLVSSVSGASSNPSITNLELMARLHGDLRSGVRSPATSSEISLEDKARTRRHSHDGNRSVGNNRSGLRRGKPNTLRSGLPSPAKRRSLDTSNMPISVHQDMVLSTVDTSPIQKLDPMIHHDENSPMIHLDYGSDDDDDDDDDETSSSLSEDDEDEHENRMHRQLSVTSVMSVAESDHDRAFIHESILADMTNISDEPYSEQKNCDGALAVGSREVPTKATTEASADINEKATSDEFKKPIGLPVSSTSAKYGDKNDVSSLSEASDSSVCTVIYNGKPITSTPRKEPMKAVLVVLGQSRSDSTLSRMDSIDSGIGSEDGKLSKSCSLQSIGSLDSGMSFGKESSNPSCLEKPHTVPLQRMLSLQRGPGAEPNLQITSHMHHMLSRAGIVSESEGKPGAKLNESACIQDEMDSLSPEELKESMEEINERHENPLRFTNSQSRRRGVSPIRIPTIFAKADQEAQKFRNLAKTAVCSSPKRKPNLPIGTGLVNAVSVQNARTKHMSGSKQSPSEFDSSKQSTPPSDNICASAGHTPMYPLGVNISLKVKDTENIENKVAVSTPKIKPMLMTSDVTKRLLAVVPPSNNETPVRRTARSPIKPVKRLQGSPKSPNPRRYSTSPAKVKNLPQHGERWSPMPAHMAAEWGV